MEGAATTVDVSGMISSITGQLGAFSTDNLITIIGAAIGVSAGLVLLWFGYGFIKRKLMGALKKGKL